MKYVITLDSIKEGQQGLAGGKAMALSRLSAKGFRIPRGVCVTTDAYNQFVSDSGLGERILLEINRKDFSDMRWEEIWDASLRIRNMFMTTPVMSYLYDDISVALERYFKGVAVVVRSSAPGEDSSEHSFAGLHDSFVNIRGTAEILEHIKKVWASLWSDGALLYRQELGLDVEKSTMAVLIQPLISGNSSGVAFSMSPDDSGVSIIESVHGLNQGLVDGTVEPDRWLLERDSGKIVSHRPAKRESVVLAGTRGVSMGSLESGLRSTPPLSHSRVLEVYQLARSAEKLFLSPQDVEWTFKKEDLFVLQSRPITTAAAEDSTRKWYLSLTRSFENLKLLLERVEGELIPQMIDEAKGLEKTELGVLTDEELALEIERRRHIFERWKSVYWEEFIPLAHGVRLFGQFYNDTIRPSDPYEFADLLAGTEMLSMDRNSRIEEMAALLRDDEALKEHVLLKKSIPSGTELGGKLEEFLDLYGDISCRTTGCTFEEEEITGIILELASGVETEDRIKTGVEAKGRIAFLNHFKGEEVIFAEDILELARSSYRLRDDDNIYLAAIEAQLARSITEGKERALLAEKGSRPEVSEVLTNALKLKQDNGIQSKNDEKETGEYLSAMPRQLLGQPAGPGIVTARARVLLEREDFISFRKGEIIICDAIDPTMTILVPLASGIIERRGGMLIHGAIIAREYGIPCVTGVPDATAFIKTGHKVTIDGYLGIVVINRRD